MTRLIVEDGGQRRGFKVGNGKLTLGSGEQAKLRLESEGVAEVHAELEVADGVITLVCKPGVLPPKLAGRALAGRVELKHDVPISIGQATIKAQYENAAPAQPVVQPVKRGQGGQRSGAKAGASRRGSGGRGRRASEPSSGLPAWAIVMIALPLVGLVVFLGKNLVMADKPVSQDYASILYRSANERVLAARWDEAEAELDRIPADAPMTDELRADVSALRERIARGRVASEEGRDNLVGNEYFEKQIESFANDFLQGTTDRSAVRVFMKRVAEFKRRWPNHPDMGWVDRQMGRFEGVVDLDDPPTFDDIRFEMKALTWGARMRNYAQAFEILDNYMAEHCDTPEAKQEALTLRAETVAKRDEWFDDRMGRARQSFEMKEYGQSVAWLVALIKYCGDEQKANLAAESLIQFEGIEERLRGYRSDDPDSFKALQDNEVIARFMERAGFE